ncbi:MAG: phage tail protein [Gemmataceae bacterium]
MAIAPFPTASADLRTLSPAAARLARLIPQVYLSRDAAINGHQLLSLLEVLAAPLDTLDKAIQALLDDHFVERASAEALPLIADLVGARLLGDDTVTNRGIIARTVHWRRRKGTLATLEEVLTQATGWATEVDEAFRSLLQTQDLAFPLPWRGRNAVLWDPIAISDPLSRRAPPVERPRNGVIDRGPMIGLMQGETVEHALRRLGRADAGRYAAAPRTIDFTGWARPEQAVIRSTRLQMARAEDVAAGRVADDGTPEPGGTVLAIAHLSDPSLAMIGFALDPSGRALPLAWEQPVTPPDETGGLTSAHEAAPPAVTPVRPALLTPTALAVDGDAVEASGSMTVTIDDVAVAGPPGIGGETGPLAFAPMGPRPVLRFADIGRPSPNDEWVLQALAIDDSATADAAVVNTGVTDENPLVATATIRRNVQDPLVLAGAAQVPRSGAIVGLRLSRNRLGLGYRRNNIGAWSGIEPGVRRGAPLTPAVALNDSGTPVIARLERQPAGDITVATWHVGAAPGWQAAVLNVAGLPTADQPDLTAAKDGPALGCAILNNALLIVAPTADHATLGVWRIDGALTAAPTITRLDQPGTRLPAARMAPACCIHSGDLFVHGGEDLQRGILGDLWSLDLSGPVIGGWIPHLVRAPRDRQHEVARTGARLLSTPSGLVLIGGATTLGGMASSVWRAEVSPGRPRPSWAALPPLPITDGAAGTLWSRADPTRLHALTWANRTAPRWYAWDDGARGWTPGPLETAGTPNPPAEGDGLFVGDEFLVIGPPPLPPSEVLVTVGGKGRIAFLPAVDLADDGDARLFFLQGDGSTQRWYPAGEPARGSLRLGAGREQPTAERTAPAPRIGIPGRLAWAPFRLRQRNLEPWLRPLALDLSGTVALDPRLGRVALPAAIACGRLGASFQFGRAAALGPGFVPTGRVVPESWREPADPDAPERFVVPTPPDLNGATVTAWVAPEAAGLTDTAPVVASLNEAIQPGVTRHMIAMRGSPRLDRATLTIGQSEVLSLFPDAATALPYVNASDGVSLLLQERLDTNADPDLGPSWFVAGLTLEGALRAGLSAGVLDVRWCRLADPAQAGLTVIGASSRTALAHLTLTPVRLTVRLFGCLVGRLEVPPWVQLIAAGCVFDGGAPDQPAIRAAGARVRLRHCTVHGTTEAGVLEASSCAFKGAVTCDRPDLGWLRYSIAHGGGRLPLLYQSLTQPISFESLLPAHPDYLVLSDNNGAAALAAGERRRVPGAHDERSARLTELTERTGDFLPLGLSPWHADRAVADLSRMQRRLT